ncbi:MAG TPA: lysozyme inhibitor LprI family protein [Terrimicrobiaceae bacterium]|nr:lysozyme inhibitor LprI family protein [Terrimicrobiaceae bacterium]
MKAPLLLVVLLLTLSTGLHAEPPEQDPIDIAMDKAMEKDPSTAGMVQAAAQADKKWQKEIERALSSLKKEMTAEQYKALQASQQTWKNFRDKEVATQSALYGALEGSMWVPVAATKEMDLDRARALLLRDYLEALSAQ